MASQYDLASLKLELKAFESEFKQANNGNNPTKNDIKARPQIAEKYSLYAKLKSGSDKATKATGREANFPSSSTSASASTSRLPTHPPSFKSPTKSKPKSSKPVPQPAPHPAPNMSPTKPTYVIANSPSKLRQLAAMHSSSNSPNHRQFNSSNGHGEGKGIVVVGSPKKYNPFASASASTSANARTESPRNGHGGTFADQLMRSVEKDKPSSRRSNSSPTKQSTSKASGGGDDIFGGSAIARSPVPSLPSVSTSSLGGKAAAVFASPSRSKGPAVDPSLGPSPVKSAPFKPLLLTEDLVVDSKPKLFSTEFESKVAKKAREEEERVREKVAEREKERARKRAESEEAENVAEEEEHTSGKGKGKAKGKGKNGDSTATGRAKKKRKLDAENGGVIGGLSVKSGAGVDEDYVMDLSDDEGSEGGTQNQHQVVIHPPRPRGYRQKGQSGKTGEEMDLDGDVEGEEESDENENERPPGSLFYRDSADLLSSHPQPETPPRSAANDSNPASPTASVDPSLLSLLSLHPNSPLKKSQILREKEKEAQLRALLEGPTKKKVTGLLDMVPDDDDDEDGLLNVEGEGEDDDWASEEEGWKSLGDGRMDGEGW